nr:MAG TPA: hypothetical protein [Caudoviricetes sp.]
MNSFGQDFNDYSFDECETVIKKIAKDFEEKRHETTAKLFKMPLGSEDVIPEICIHKGNIRFSYKTKVAIIEYQEPICLTVERGLSDPSSFARFVSDVTKEIGRLYEKAICNIRKREINV